MIHYLPIRCLSGDTILAILNESRQVLPEYFRADLTEFSEDTLKALKRDLEDSAGEDIPGLLEQLQKELDSRN